MIYVVYFFEWKTCKFCGQKFENLYNYYLFCKGNLTKEKCIYCFLEVEDLNKHLENCNKRLGSD